jgi:hypothetical protein
VVAAGSPLPQGERGLIRVIPAVTVSTLLNCFVFRP